MNTYEVPGQTGDCISCARLSSCSVTSPDKVKGDFTCPLYVPVAEPIYYARDAMIRQFGVDQAVRALLGGREKGDDEK